MPVSKNRHSVKKKKAGSFLLSSVTAGNLTWFCFTSFRKTSRSAPASQGNAGRCRLQTREKCLLPEICIELKEKAGSFLLSRVCSIIDVRELDFRVRNGNGYYLSTMATGILLPILIRSFIRKTGMRCTDKTSGTDINEGCSAESVRRRTETIIWSSLTTY